MLGYSKIQIMGHVGATPEYRVLPSGDHVVNFSVAVTRRFKDREDHPKEVTDWFRICAYNGIGSACANFIGTGDAIFVEGRLQVRTFESRNGEQTAIEIIPSVVRFLGSAHGASSGDRNLRATPGQPRAKVNGHGSQAAVADESETDELPF
jgi:single stranded DNA-binding protein